MPILQQLNEAVQAMNTDSLNEGLKSLFEGVDIAEELREQFEGIVVGEVKAQAVKLADAYITEAAQRAEELLAAEKQTLVEGNEEYKQYLKETYAQKVDGYLDLKLNEWQEKNQIAVVNSLKVQMFDNLVEGMKTLFNESNIAIPDDKVDVVTELEESLTEMETKYSDIVTQLSESKTELGKYQRKQVLAERLNEHKDLTESQVEKITMLSESFQFADEETFGKQVDAVIDFATGATKFNLNESKGSDDADKGGDDDKGQNFKPDSDDDKGGKKKDEDDKDKKLNESYIPDDLRMYARK